MSDTPRYTRREFVGSSLAMISTIASVPGFVNRSAFAASPRDASQTSQPGVPQDRILLVVQLSGGNDGLNTVVPFGSDDYYKARPTLGIAQRDLISLDNVQGIGLNPGLAPLRELYDQGLVSIVQGVGYPNPNRSHFASMDIWHTGDTRGGKGTGWLGRALDRQADSGKAPGAPMIAIGDEAPLAGEGARTKPIAFENANLYRWVGGDLHPALAKRYDTLNRAGQIHDQDDQLAFVMRTALDAQVSSDRIRQAVSRGPMTSFPANGLGQQLQMIAAMIRAELPTRVYYAALGGFDTHAGQPFRQQRQLNEFAASMQAFYRELKAMGQDQRVLTMVFSEFGRRVEQNASNGTDHGAAGPMFVLGPMVRPGVAGAHPSLTQLDRGDLIHHTDFRSVYANILTDWLSIDAPAVLGQPFKSTNLIKV